MKRANGWMRRVTPASMLRFAVTSAVSAGLAVSAMGYRGVSENAAEMGTATARPNPFEGAKLYVNPNSPARKQAHDWRKSRPRDAAAMEHIASQPTARWITGWSKDVTGEVASKVREASTAGAMPLLVAYNIPQRDCGSYSAGGASAAATYRKWIREFAKGLAGSRAAVILEPDAIAGANCLDDRSRTERYSLIADAVSVLSGAGAAVYVDAGHAAWIPADEMAKRLKSSGIAGATGFALNVSNYGTNQANVVYGEKLSKLTGGKHFVIDTSRNGAGSNGEWCNPNGRALGTAPTARTGSTRADAFLWIKVPGESDGTCNGGPGAGKWWADYALGLAKRAPGA